MKRGEVDPRKVSLDDDGVDDVEAGPKSMLIDSDVEGGPVWPGRLVTLGSLIVSDVVATGLDGHDSAVSEDGNMASVARELAWRVFEAIEGRCPPRLWDEDQSCHVMEVFCAADCVVVTVGEIVPLKVGRPDSERDGLVALAGGAEGMILLWLDREGLSDGDTGALVEMEESKVLWSDGVVLSTRLVDDQLVMNTVVGGFDRGQSPQADRSAALADTVERETWEDVVRSVIVMKER